MFILVSSSLLCASEKSDSVVRRRNIPPKKIVFVDGHGTLWEPWHHHFIQAFTTTWLQASITGKKDLLLVLANPRLWLNLKAARREVFDLFIHDLCKDVPLLEQHRKKIISNYNLHVLAPAMVIILRKLKSTGCTLLLGSNIGSESLAYLLNHQPEINELMEGYCIVDCLDSSVELLRHKIGEKPLYLSSDVKPNNPYFEQAFTLAAQFTKNESSQVAFVDDRLDIITASKKAGFIGIHATSADQTLMQLQAAGFLNDTKKSQ